MNMEQGEGREGDMDDETVESRGGTLRKPSGFPENDPGDKTGDEEKQAAQGLKKLYMQEVCKLCVLVMRYQDVAAFCIGIRLIFVNYKADFHR